MDKKQLLKYGGIGIAGLVAIIVATKLASGGSSADSTPSTVFVPSQSGDASAATAADPNSILAALGTSGTGDSGNSTLDSEIQALIAASQGQAAQNEVDPALAFFSNLAPSLIAKGYTGASGSFSVNGTPISFNFGLTSPTGNLPGTAGNSGGTTTGGTAPGGTSGSGAGSSSGSTPGAGNSGGGNVVANAFTSNAQPAVDRGNAGGTTGGGDPSTAVAHSWGEFASDIAMGGAVVGMAFNPALGVPAGLAKLAMLGYKIQSGTTSGDGAIQAHEGYQGGSFAGYSGSGGRVGSAGGVSPGSISEGDKGNKGAGTGSAGGDRSAGTQGAPGGSPGGGLGGGYRL